MRDGNAVPRLCADPWQFRFEPTYEGWKRRLLDSPGPAAPSFEPTYEGWKLWPSKQPGWYAHVSSLPMRDGNSSCATSAASCSTVSSLPMRDGNSRSAPPDACGPSCFEPTYEGWKLEEKLRRVGKVALFRAYL